MRINKSILERSNIIVDPTKMTHEEVMEQLHNFTVEELIEELQNAGIELEEIQKGGN